MRIIRYQTTDGQIYFGAEPPSGETLRIEGDIFSNFRVTDERAQVAKLLAPVSPPAILCIGLNYKRHAAESNLPAPQFPVLFVKGTAKREIRPNASNAPPINSVPPARITITFGAGRCRLSK